MSFQPQSQSKAVHFRIGSMYTKMMSIMLSPRFVSFEAEAREDKCKGMHSSIFCYTHTPKACR